MTFLKKWGYNFDILICFANTEYGVASTCDIQTIKETIGLRQVIWTFTIILL
jgi:hypothetical protein